MVKTLFILLGISFTYVLFVGMGGQVTSKPVNHASQFSDLTLGQTTPRRVADQLVWVTRLNAQQREQLIQSQEQLINPQSGCDSQLAFCVLSAATARHGVNITYSKMPPPQLPGNANWIGGFVDPSSGATFDLLGRAYRLGRDSDAQTMQIVQFMP